MIISNSITRKYLVVIIGTVIIAQFLESQANNDLNQMTRDNSNQQEKPPQEQKDATVSEILTINNAELDRIIHNSGIFLSPEEWNRKRESVVAKLTTASIYDEYEKTRSTRAQTRAPANAPSQIDNDRIIFPANNRLIPDPNACKDNLCEDVPNYPQELIERAVKNYKGPMFSTKEELPASELGPRMGSDAAIDFCGRQIKKIEPKIGKAVFGDYYRYIVNVGNITHILLTETCSAPDCACTIIQKDIIDGYTPTCKQKYAQRELHAIDPDGGRIYLDTFKYPVSCCCELLPNL